MAHKVLFVDDEASVVEGFRNALRKEAFEIVTATSGEEGLKVLRNDTIDVVVSDELMPGMSGSEFLSLVSKEFPSTIRILLTGYANVEVAIRALNDGEIYRFLTKPFQAADLAVTIRNAISLKALKDEEAEKLEQAKALASEEDLERIRKLEEAAKEGQG